MNEHPLDTWKITLPDNTEIIDEIEYGMALTVTGVQYVPMRNRRTVIHPDGEVETVPVPENYEENRKDLQGICDAWAQAGERFENTVRKREERYRTYKEWLSDHLGGTQLSQLLFSAATRA